MADTTSDKAATPPKDEQPPAPPAPPKADPVPADAEPAGEALGTGAREDRPDTEGE